MVKEIADSRIAAMFRDTVDALEDDHGPGLVKKAAMALGASAALAFVAVRLTRAVIARRARSRPEETVRPADATAIQFKDCDYPEPG